LDNRTFVVTGLMRSGTSFLARTLNELGVQMGSTMRFPDAGTPGSQLDWEDAEFTQKIAEAIIGGHPLPDFAGYIASRGDGLWGLKSPTLLPFLPDFLLELEKAGRQPVLIVTERPYVETLQSMNHQLRMYRIEVLEIMVNVQRQLEAAHQWALERADLVVKCADSRSCPTEVREEVRVLLQKFETSQIRTP